MNQQLSSPTGNLHVALLRVAEIATKRYVEPRLKISIWDDLARPFATQALKGMGIPDKSLTPAQVFEKLFPTRTHRRARCTRG